MALTEQDRIQEQVDLDPWLSRQEWVLTRTPDGKPMLRVYVEDLRTVPFGHVRDVGCQVIYKHNVAIGPVHDPSPLTCEQRGLKER